MITEPSAVFPLGRLLTRKQAGDILQMSETWIKRQIRAGRIPTVCLGKATRIEESDLQEFIQARKTTVVKTVGTLSGSPGGGPDQSQLQVVERIVIAG